MANPAMTPDESMRKGAVEDETPEPNGTRRSQNSMAGQLGHRDQDEMLKDNDTDYPEPNAEAEHSGA